MIWVLACGFGRSVGGFFPEGVRLQEGVSNNNFITNFLFRFLLRFVLQDSALRTIVQCYSKYNYKIFQTYKKSTSKYFVSPLPTASTLAKCTLLLLRQLIWFNTVVNSQCFLLHPKLQPLTNKYLQLCPTTASFCTCMQVSNAVLSLQISQSIFQLALGFLGLRLRLA